MNVQTNVLIKEECIMKNKNKSCPYMKLYVFYNSCLKTFGSYLVYSSVALPAVIPTYTSTKKVQCRQKSMERS